MAEWVERKPTMELQIVTYKQWMGPAPFDFIVKERLEQKWEVVRGGTGDGVKYEDEWVPVPKVSEGVAR